MKLLLFVCMCALAAAEQQPALAPSTAQLAVGLQHLYRNFMHVVAPKQLEIQDALDIQFRNGMMASPRFVSQVKATFGGDEVPAFSYVNSLITPGQKGIFGQWLKNDQSDMVITYNYGGDVKIHMLTYGGIHKEVILGNPANHKGAKFVVLVPKNTYSTFESLSEEDNSFVSYLAIPAWNPAHLHHYSQKEMEIKFPTLADTFKELAKPGVHDSDGHHDDEHDFDYEREYRYGRPSRQSRYGRLRRH